MSVDILIEYLLELQAEGHGSDNVMVPCETGGSYTPSSAYEFDGDVYIN